MHIECPDLLVAMLMLLPQAVPLFVTEIIHAVLLHNRPSLCGVVTCGTQQHHCRDSARLLCGHMQERIAAAAYAYRFELVDTNVVEQGKHLSDLSMKKWS